MAQPISLQSPWVMGMTQALEILSKSKRQRIHDMTAYSLLREKIIDVLDSLTERERNALPRFGLKDGYSRTLEEVGDNFR